MRQGSSVEEIAAALLLFALPGLAGCAHPLTPVERAAAPAPVQRAPAPVDPVSLEVRPVVIPAPPNRVLPALFRAIAEGRRLDAALLGSLGAGGEGARSGGATVLTWAGERGEWCGAHSWELVPPATWDAFCKTAEGPLRGIGIDATPSVPSDHSEGLMRADPEAVTRYSYPVEQALSDASVAGIPFEDITQAFQMNWPGHFPFMESVHVYVRPGQLLVLIYGEIGPTRPNVMRVSIYTR